MTNRKIPPVLSNGEAEELINGSTPEEAAEKIKILIVEDEQTTRLLYDKGLVDQVFEKRMVASGKEALVVYGSWRPDIILLDIFLQEITGYQVLKEIRSVFGDRQTTIAMATSLSGRDDVLSCLKLGADGYILKPFQRGEIGTKILGYYAKREPERARKAAALCTEVLKRFQVQALLGSDRPPMRPKAAVGQPEKPRGKKTREKSPQKDKRSTT